MLDVRKHDMRPHNIPSLSQLRLRQLSGNAILVYEKRRAVKMKVVSESSPLSTLQILASEASGQHPIYQCATVAS
ncbi:hypothetical protein D3C80_2068080 [compost metagenome]